MQSARRARACARIAAALLLVVLGFTAREALAEYGSFDGVATHVYQEPFFLEQGQSYSFETKNLSPGGDTVMYLWSEELQQQVAFNDDHEGLASRVQYSPAQTGMFHLIVRAYSNTSRGSCDIWFQDQPHTSTTFAGWKVEASPENGDVYSTVHLLGGVTDSLVYVFDNEAMELRGMDDDSGVAYAAKWVANQVSSSGRFVVVSVCGIAEELAVRLLVNDAGLDRDGDGLGPGLERSLCSCDFKEDWFSCTKAGGPPYPVVDCNALPGVTTDTDNDGLDDDWEAIGIDDASFPQTLVTWGADPARKDIFVELDWMLGANQLTTTEAGKIAPIYNAASSAASLLNPDGTDGVKVHLDVGLAAPCTDHNNPSCTAYGSWGGGQLTASPYWTCTNDWSVHQATQPSCPGGTAVQGGREHHSYQAFAQVRRGVFHYGITAPAGDGGRSNQPGYNLIAGAKAGTVGHELGHCVAVAHHGALVRGAANCKPNYQSLMNYAFGSLEVFSQNTTTYSLDPTDLCEADGIGTSDYNKVQILDTNPFNYDVQQQPGGIWGVDWNRDKVITGCGTVVQAPVNSSGAPSMLSCEWSRYRMDKPISGSTALAKDQTPGLVHVHDGAQSLDRTYIFYRNGTSSSTTEIRYLASSSDFNVANPTGCPLMIEFGCGAWSSPVLLSDGSTRPTLGTGPAAAVFSTTQDPGPYVAVAWQVPASPSPKLYYKVLDPADGSIVSQGWVDGSHGVTHEPSMVAYEDGLMMAFRKSDGKLWMSQMTSSSLGFTSPGLSMMNQSAITISTSPSLASYLSGSTRKIRAVLVDSSKKLFWVERWPSMGWNTWTNVTAGTNIDAHKTDHKVGFAWVPALFGSQPGRFFIVWADATSCTAGNCNAKLDYTRGDGTGSIAAVFENKSYADNMWFSAYRGFSLFLDPAIDHNLRMVSVYQRSGKQELNFRPFADGRFPVLMKDNDDYMVMRTGVCASLRGCDASRCGSNPLSPSKPCPAETDGTQACPPPRVIEDPAP